MKKILAILLILISYMSYSQCAIDTLAFPNGAYLGCFPSQFTTQLVSCENGQTWTVSQILQFESTGLPVTVQMTSLTLPAPIQGLLLDDCGNVIWNTDQTCLSVNPISATGLTNQLIYTIDFQLPAGIYYWATHVPAGNLGCYLVSIGTFSVLALPLPEQDNTMDELIDDMQLPDGKYFQAGIGFYIIRRGIKYNLYGLEIQ